MLDANLKAQPQTYLRAHLRQPIEIVASLDDSACVLEDARTC